MLNFTVGPVMSDPEILEIANHSTPYFRTPEFSRIMLENESLILEYLNAPQGSKCVFLTSSGTGAMESCVMNVLNEQDKVIVINGGTFGQRFAELCDLHGLTYDEIKCDFGHQIHKGQLDKYNNCGYTALLVNMDETSSGTLYDMKMISDFCRDQGVLLIVDAISSFLADDIDMEKMGAAVVLTGSQKALAVQPGISVIALAPAALDRIENNKEKCLYLSLKQALVNMTRGQTPFTPAVTILLQINMRLLKIKHSGGIQAELKRIYDLTYYFRDKIKRYPFEFVSESSSNAVTALKPLTCKASDIVRELKDQYHIWVCPNGGDYSDTVFRVGHIGYLTKSDYDKLFEALDDMCRRGII